MLWLQGIFFLSGFSALVYQVVWQRALFAIFGINSESVTVIVTAFMLGLGLGSAIGGLLARSPRRPALLLFAVAEAGIGIFGLLSLGMFHSVGRLTLALPPLGTGLVTFLLLLVPTLLMGATLPLLTAHLVKRWGNVGRSVSALYAVNTLGSAAAALVAAFLLLEALGQAGSVRIAAAGNLVVAAVALGRWRTERRDA